MIARATLVLLALALAPAAAPAAFTVSIGNAAVAPGGRATIDVFVTGPELLDFFVAEFVITLQSGGGPAGALQFVNPQTSFVSNPRYVFVGNSAALSQEVTTTSPPAGPLDILTVGDETSNPLGVDVSGGRLLAQLEVQVDAGVDPDSVFQISLNPNASAFQNTAGVEVLPLFSSPGAVTVGAPLAVPAPGSLVALTTGLPVLAGWAWARRTRRAVAV